MTVPFPDMQHWNNTCVHISKFAGTDCRLAFLSSLCTSLSLFFRDLGCLFLLAPPWAAFPVERFKPCFLGPIRSFAEVVRNIQLSPRYLIQRLPLTEGKTLFNLSQDSIIAALDHVAYLSPKLWATTLKNQRLEELKAYIGTTIFGVNNFKTLNHANLWWFEQWCLQRSAAMDWSRRSARIVVQHFFFQYSQTCIKRSPFGNGLLTA